jgi:hypothetical protein
MPKFIKTILFATMSYIATASPETLEIGGVIFFAATGAYCFWRWRQRQRFHALLYTVAASAWLAACSTEG